MVRDLHEKIVGFADDIIDSVSEKGSCDFVEEISAELPLLVIAEMLGIPHEDRRMVFDWSNQMIGSEDPEYQIAPEAAGEAAMGVYAYADELSNRKRGKPGRRRHLGAARAEVEGEKSTNSRSISSSSFSLWQGTKPTRNLMSGAMAAFFEHRRPVAEAVGRPIAASVGDRGDASLGHPGSWHFRRTAVNDTTLGGQRIQAGDKVVFWHASANRDEKAFDDPGTFDITRSPNTHIAFGGGGPHFCLGANLARMEIQVMFDRVLERVPDIHLDGKVQRLQSNFINGTQHIPVAFAPSAPLGR